MADPYRVLVYVEALEVLPRSGSRRRRVMMFLKELGEVAHLGGDEVRKEPESGRLMQISQVAGFAISWWIDAPVRQVQVVDILPLARP